MYVKVIGMISCPDNFLFTRDPIHAYVLQVIIVANHMSGKDTHVRGLRILGPLVYAVVVFLTFGSFAHHTHRNLNLFDDDPFPFISSELRMYERIR